MVVSSCTTCMHPKEGHSAPPCIAKGLCWRGIHGADGSVCVHDEGSVRAAKEFAPVKDPQDGYSFVYPFGWQEVAVKGQDVVYKDVIEPLESVSVSITQTDKADVTEFGSPAEVCHTPD